MSSLSSTPLLVSYQVSWAPSPVLPASRRAWDARGHLFGSRVSPLYGWGGTTWWGECVCPFTGLAAPWGREACAGQDGPMQLEPQLWH